MCVCLCFTSRALSLSLIRSLSFSSRASLGLELPVDSNISECSYRYKGFQTGSEMCAYLCNCILYALNALKACGIARVTCSCRSFSCREHLSCVMLLSFSCTTACLSASHSFRAASLAWSSERVFWRAQRRSWNTETTDYKCGFIQDCETSFDSLVYSRNHRTHWPGCVSQWPPCAAVPPADQSWVCPWTSSGRLLASGSVSDSSDWPPAPDQGRTGSSVPPPVHPAAERASRTRWPPLEPGERMTTDHSQYVIRFLAILDPGLHQYTLHFISPCIEQAGCGGPSLSAYTAWWSALQSVGTAPGPLIRINLGYEHHVKYRYHLTLGIPLILNVQQRQTLTSWSLVLLDSARPWMVLSWLWAAWRIERSSHSISFSFSCSFYRRRQPPPSSDMDLSNISKCNEAFLCALPCCWPRSRGSWPAGIGPGAGPSAARWHIDQPHTHTGLADSAAPQRGSEVRCQEFKAIKTTHYIQCVNSLLNYLWGIYSWKIEKLQAA